MLLNFFAVADVQTTIGAPERPPAVTLTVGSASINNDLPSDIIVTARRPDAVPPSEVEYNEDDIAADGSDNIGELLSSLQRFIDPSGNKPVILINGKPSGFDTSILAFPVEALVKVSVLKSGSGPRYGATSDARVVNLVLKRKFSSLETDVAANLATSGGQQGITLGLSRSAVSGDTRWTAHVQSNVQTALLRSDRQIPGQDGVQQGLDQVLFLGGTNVPAALREPGGMVASSPSFDTDDGQTLLPSSRSVSAGFNVARPVGGLAASVSVDGSRSVSHGLRGIPTATLFIPAVGGETGDGTSVLIGGSRPLRSDNAAQTFGASMTLTGMVRQVQTNLALNLSSSYGQNQLETGANGARLQQFIDAQGAGFDPATPFDPSILGVQRTHTQSTNLNLRMSLQRSLAHLPAGTVSWNLSATTSNGRGKLEQDEGLQQTFNRTNYSQSGAQISVSLPVSADGSAFPTLGDLTLDLGLGGQTATGGSTEMSYEVGMTWIPFSPVQFRGSFDRAQNAPSFDQLNGPVVVTVDKIFDYATRQFTDVTWTTGGNSQLVNGSQTNISLSMLLRPLAQHDLALNVGLRKFFATDTPTGFPELTPAIEAAFPSRITRDGTGRLVAIDARPINLERQKDATLASTLTLRLGERRSRSRGSPNLALDRTRIDFTLNYQLRLESIAVVERNIPKIDRLASSGTSRHQLDFRLGVGRRAFGSNLSTSWRSTAYVTDSTGIFRVTPPLLFNLSLFANVDRLSEGLKTRKWSRRTKVSVDVQNLFRGYRHVMLPNGGTPPGYSRDEVDPLGRTLRVALKKQF